MRSTMKYILLALLGAMLMSVSLFAAGGDEEKTEETDTDKQKQATEAYNSGVKHVEKAREILKKGDSTYAYNYRATSDAKAGKEYEQAVDDFRAAVELDPEMKQAWNYLGYSHRKLGNLEASLSAYQEAIELDPNYAQAREYLGETYLAMGQMDKAMEQYNKLKELESPYTDTLNMAIELYRLKELDQKMQGSATGK